MILKCNNDWCINYNAGECGAPVVKLTKIEDRRDDSGNLISQEDGDICCLTFDLKK